MSVTELLKDECRVAQEAFDVCDLLARFVDEASEDHHSFVGLTVREHSERVVGDVVKPFGAFRVAHVVPVLV